MHTIYRPKAIVWLRHAEYWWNVLYHNSFDLENPAVQEALKYIVDREEQHVKLTPAGRKQAIATGVGLAELYPKGFDSILFSPWDRVVETIELILPAWPEKAQDHMRINMHPSYKLVEQYQGDGVQFLASEERDQWQFQYDRLMQLLEKKHRDHRMFRRKGLPINGNRFDESMTGESACEFAIRIGRFLQRLFQPHYNDQTVLVVTHFAAIEWLRSNLLGLTPEQTVKDLNDGSHPISNCGTGRFDYIKGVRGENNSKPPLRWEQTTWNQVFYKNAVMET